jgi:hypothetical protein
VMPNGRHQMPASAAKQVGWMVGLDRRPNKNY